MKLIQLLRGVDLITVKGDKNLEITSISYDSRQVKPGGIFFAIKGNALDGTVFIDEALERGAACVVSEADFITYKNICKVLVKDARKACALMAANFYEHPSEKINVTGITGTNGKTTILYLIESILSHSAKQCGIIGTINYKIGERNIPACNTTPSPIMLNMFMREMLDNNIINCAMEVSSHSLHQRRTDSIRYKNAIFTNLTSEHLDYHKNMEDYFLAKKMLFDMLPEGACAISNIDDEYGKRILTGIKARILTYAINSAADITACDINSSVGGSSFKVKTPNGEITLSTPLIGEYNIYNILAGIGFAIADNIDFNCLKEAVKDFKGAPGRLQKISAGQNFSVFVDYAHTDDALKKVLTALKAINKNRIIVVFGCGGDRDKTKRPRMGKTASELADFIFITSDNPRSELPEIIIEDILRGIPKEFKECKVHIDRKEAIESALAMAGKDDIVLIAGKGHEKHQIFKDTTIPFDDCQVAEDALKAKVYVYPVTNI